FVVAERPRTERVIQERYAYQFDVDNSEIAPQERQQMRDRHIGTLLLLPMVFQDKLMGLVEVVEHGRKRPFTDQEISLAQLLTNQAAAAIANARLYEELNRRLQELASLHQISQAVTSTLDLAKTLTIITDHTLTLLGVEAVSVALLDGGRQEVWYAAASGKAANAVRGKRMILGEDSMSQAILQGEVVLQTEVATTDPYYSLFEQMGGLQVRAVLSVPLQAQGEVLGAIQAFNRENGNGRFTQEDVNLLNSLAAPAAAAIANARLYQQARQEISERVRIEGQIQASLAEKEVLLKEIHHRVKNNLQVISSLINLQSDYVSDKRALEIFQESQNRIRSMALIHEKLYRSDNLAQIDMADYLRDLCIYLFRAHSAQERGVALNLHVDHIYLGINTAVPCGLLLNELISNALKHGFPERRQGFVSVNMRRQSAQQVQLQVQDDGVGFPEDIDFRCTASLGLRLVNTLVGQLDG
ncbi:MAG: GAF domain-containing protein, partial [Anaerolineales bacterium]|nr:GAF domain-containing protein [Anaerolineales bacterium]